jgi:hypothetical protein
VEAEQHIVEQPVVIEEIRGKIRKVLEYNENENITNLN